METTKQLFNSVVNEINSDFNTLKNANKIFKHYCSTNKYNVEFKCVFGWFSVGNGNLKSRLPRLKYTSSNDSIRGYKNGIEILGMIPERPCSISELKAACKMNGIKKYSKKDKCELVAALMKC